MPVSDEEAKADALEVALEWVLFHLVSTAPNPPEVLKDFDRYLAARERLLEETGNEQLIQGNVGTYSNLKRVSDALVVLRSHIMTTIHVTGKDG